MMYQYFRAALVFAAVVISGVLLAIVLTSPRQTVVSHWDSGPDGTVTNQTVTTYQLATE